LLLAEIYRALTDSSDHLLLLFELQRHQLSRGSYFVGLWVPSFRNY
jgi:hypothetical protein